MSKLTQAMSPPTLVKPAGEVKGLYDDGCLIEIEAVAVGD
jgi:hypothetical protein